jgi:uncharacterized membrane protein YphA (DoxX/SURF4 family)
MANASHLDTELVHRAGVPTPARQAFHVLRVGFALLPIAAGTDKFFGYLASWDHYLAPQVARMLPVSTHSFMSVVGIVEIVAGLIVALRPRIGSYVVAAWLCGIIVNLLMHGGYADVALRDFGLMFGALALGRLSEEYDHPGATSYR